LLRMFNTYEPIAECEWPYACTHLLAYFFAAETIRNDRVKYQANL